MAMPNLVPKGNNRKQSVGISIKENALMGRDVILSINVTYATKGHGANGCKKNRDKDRSPDSK